VTAEEAARPAAAIASAAEARRGLLADDLLALIDVETPSDDLALLETGLAHIRSWLERRVGAPARVTAEGGEGAATHLVLEYPSPLADPDEAWVAALCHYDTVWPAGTTAERPAAIDGDRITGPGAFDMKGGLVQFAHALAIVDELGLRRPGVRLVLNGDEEIGSVTSRALIERTVAESGAVLVFEASAGGAVKTARKGVGMFDILVTGVETHAGLDPEGGASAVDELARIVLALHAAADLDAGTSVNVGVVAGGTRRNVKAGSARAQVDVRVSSAAEAERIDGVLAALAPANPRAQIRVEGGWNRPVMERTPATAELFGVAQRAAADLGFELREIAVGGASDGNFAAALGNGVLDGLGAVGDGAHARHEWVSLDGMVERTALAAAVLARL
jgi:glutamate carboxypeptidase